MGVQRQGTVRRETALAGQRAGTAARREADLLEQDRERDGEAVVDAG